MQISNRQQMFKNISRWQESGLSQKAWCEKNGMAYATGEILKRGIVDFPNILPFEVKR